MEKSNEIDFGKTISDVETMFRLIIFEFEDLKRILKNQTQLECINCKFNNRIDNLNAQIEKAMMELNP